MDYGFALLLTNDESYWAVPKGVKDTVDSAFRTHEGKKVGGRLAWGQGASAGTMGGGRNKPIELLRSCTFAWKDYSNLPQSRGRLRYLLVRIE